jgi:hypothetical protein
MTQPAPVPTPPPGDPAPAPTPALTGAPAADLGAPDQPLGPAGQKALATEREARKVLEARLKALEPLQQLADVIGGGQKPPDGKSEVDLLTERFATYESQLTEERTARWRAEVAAAKGLTPQQAARLQGASLEEFVADADALIALFPAAGPRTPAPDPSQGARGGQPGPDLQAQIDAAKTAGDFKKAISLERQKLLSVTRPT